MPLRQIIEPEAFAMLTGVLDQHCTDFRIKAKQEWENVAATLVRLYQDGLSNPSELAAALAERETGFRGRSTIGESPAS